MADGHLKCTAVVSRREYKMSISVHAILTLRVSVKKPTLLTGTMYVQPQVQGIKYGFISTLYDKGCVRILLTDFNCTFFFLRYYIWHFNNIYIIEKKLPINIYLEEHILT